MMKRLLLSLALLANFGETTVLRPAPLPLDRRFNPEERRARMAQVKKEMTADQVQRLLGRPDSIARQILFRRHFEQWIYADLGMWIEFVCLRGEEPRVTRDPLPRP